MLPSGLLKSTKCLGAVYNTGNETRIRSVRVLQVVMVLDTRLVHPMKNFFHLHMINIFLVRCLVASNVEHILPWKRLLLTGCKKGRSSKTARWWWRKSQNRLWCSTDRWGVRANSQQVKVGWSASSRDMNCTNLLSKRRNPKSFRVLNVESD